MIKNKELFEQLVSEAVQQEFSGWDFSFVDQRWRMNPTSWDYRQNLVERIRPANSLLDMGTGGGEFLASLSPLPKYTCATESYAPNVPVAKERLSPLGVQVYEIEAGEALPFEAEHFELVINRHESFSEREVYRILKPGGMFITQQVGGHDNIRLNELLQPQVKPGFPYWGLAEAVEQLEEAGLRVVNRQEEFPETVVSDIGAVVYYLKAIPWQIADFSVEQYYDRLADLHNKIQDTGNLVIKSHRFYIEAFRE